MKLNVFKELKLQANDIEENTWLRGDVKFIFSCSNRYLTSKRSERMRYRFEHEKINFISQATMLYFVHYINPLISMFFGDFPEISDHFLKIFKDFKCCLKVVWMFPNIFRTFPEIFEDCRRLSKTAEEDPKMFRLNIVNLWLIEHWNMANSASWLVKNDITRVDIIFFSTLVIPFLSICSIPLQFI